jgi:hypothetical protein
MSEHYESISAPPNEPPTVRDELDERSAHCAILAAWFVRHPWQDITPDELRDLIGPNYQQRISDLRCRDVDPLCIENVPKWFTPETGRKRKLSGNYVFKPQPSLGRDPSLPTHQAELFR